MAHNSQQDCLICDRIQLIQQGQNTHFVRELETGYVVLGDHQFFHGYTLFLCKQHKKELHELDHAFKVRFLEEMSLVAEAVFYAFKPQKLNYELLGNTDSHLHWHLFPRHKDDPLPTRTVWNIPKEVRNAEAAKPNKKILDELILILTQTLEYRLKSSPLTSA